MGCGCGTRRSLVAGKVWQSQRLGPRASVGREGLTFHGLVAVKCGIPQTVDFDLSSVLDGEVRLVRSNFPKEGDLSPTESTDPQAWVGAWCLRTRCSWGARR